MQVTDSPSTPVREPPSLLLVPTNHSWSGTKLKSEKRPSLYNRYKSDIQLSGTLCDHLLQALDTSMPSLQNGTPGCSAYRWTSAPIQKEHVSRQEREILTIQLWTDDSGRWGTTEERPLPSSKVRSFQTCLISNSFLIRACEQVTTSKWGCLGVHQLDNLKRETKKTAGGLQILKKKKGLCIKLLSPKYTAVSTISPLPLQ